MIKLLIVIAVIGLLVCGGVLSFSINKNCVKIDYDNKPLWDYFHSRNLYPIIDYKTNQPIKYPIGCEG